MMMKNIFPAAWLCLCLSLLANKACPQDAPEAGVTSGPHVSGVPLTRLPPWQVGLELARPVHQQFRDFTNWDKALPLEAVGQLRLGTAGWYSQLQTGYFWGEKAYANGSILHQNGFYLKPGLLFAVADASGRHALTVEGNLIFSSGRIKGENSFYGPVFGDYTARARAQVRSYGAELGIGTEFLRLGPYKLKLLARAGMVSDDGDGEAFYIPGAGYVGSNFIRLTGGLNLYLMRAGGQPQSN